ncbi:hypothetical protein [Nostoc mirabile]|nr:hypothetical protein [Nostoc mirabile]
MADLHSSVNHQLFLICVGSQGHDDKLLYVYMRSRAIEAQHLGK